MTSYDKDPTTGHPLFRDSDAPDVKQDPQEAAEYAAKVGTRLIGPTVDRLAYEYVREGLRWYDTTTDVEYVHTGSGWIVAALRPFNTTAPTLLFHGRTSITTDPNGLFDLVFPTPFPNSCDRVLITSADIGAYYGGFAISGLIREKASGRCAVSSATFNVDWIAVGR